MTGSAAERPAVDPPWRRAATAVAALAVGLLIAVYYIRVLELRWLTSAYLFDMGWYNDLVSGRTLGLDNPRGIGAFSYYSIHVAPILAAFSALSRLLHLQGLQPLLLCLGLGFGGAAAMSVVVVERFLRPAGLLPALGGGVLVGLALGLSGIMRSTGDYAHIEILYVPLALLTLHLLFQNRGPWAWAALAACLATREDAGLHLACILGAYLVLATIDERGVPARLRRLAPALAACLIYPVLAIVWQRTTTDAPSTFQQIYAGSPPYQHLTLGLVAHRARLFVGEQAWVSLTLLCTLSVPPFVRRWPAATGLLASAPWVLLNVTAFSTPAGELRLYYAFPFLVTALAPFIVTAAAPLPPKEEGLHVVAF